MIVEDYDPSKHKLKNNELTKVLIIGSTGSGKSSFCNTLIGDSTNSLFKESKGVKSFTLSTSIKEVNWFDCEDSSTKNNKDKFVLIDTPGMNDSENRDTHHISNMVDLLKEKVEYLNAFVLVLNSANPRLDDSLKAMITTFYNMFGKQFLNQLIIVFTRWSYEEKEILKRSEIGETEEFKQYEINNELSSLLNIKIKNTNSKNLCSTDNSNIIKYSNVFNFNNNSEEYYIQCFFICNLYNRANIRNKSTDKEMDKFYQSLFEIKKTIKQFPVYRCSQINKAKSCKDEIKDKLDKQIKLNEEHKLSRGGCKIKDCNCLQYCYSTNEFKKKSSYLIAGAGSGGGILGGLPGFLTGIGLGGAASGVMYFHLDICFCGHEKNEHYIPLS